MVCIGFEAKFQTLYRIKYNVNSESTLHLLYVEEHEKLQSYSKIIVEKSGRLYIKPDY